MADSEHHYLSPAQLRVGVFVILDLPWLSHSFALNSFRIRDAGQLADLRALGLKRYRYDPRRCDPPVVAAAEAPPPQPACRDAGDSGHDAAPERALSATQDQHKAERAAALEQHRARIGEVERAFVKAASVMRNLNQNLVSRPQPTLEEMNGLVGQMVSTFLESPDATLHVLCDRPGGEEIYYHSLNVAILSLMLAADLGFDRDAAQNLGIGALIHDIGLMEIPGKVLNKNPSEYTSAERRLRELHVEYGAKLAGRLGVSNAVLAVVAEHHEMADGSGYPKGLSGSAMHPAARIVSLVNHYDSLCNPFDLAKALTPHEALSLMFAKHRSRFDARALQLLIKKLGVYPPGSFVQLSNGALATVTAINPSAPLRPTVLIYDQNIPREDAIVLDLAKEPEIAITKALRPGLLPPAVVAYLNPRKHISYFFDGAGPEQAGSGRFP
jgi:putative nucleotidyltransferase with HDIG domain